MLKYEEKLLVLNLKHVEELEPETKALVKGLLRDLSLQLKIDHKFYVCDQDESYSQHVIDIITDKLKVDGLVFMEVDKSRKSLALGVTNTDELQAQEIQSLREQVRYSRRV